ncbi:enoyl-CoA hydratase/isomerase family protein [Brevibacillus migulae]|uniref:enoyl-CoA hydratase/isomerase family protein n=1 Tax=Brevibacillus migulae TaxID=1644114 RepID=UPI00106E021D|nr:enoyl-CoA hydratase-related protein [Brevibacillus migulae]
MSEAIEKQIMTELQDGVFTITLNRPKVLNALTLEMFHGLAQVISQAAEDPQAEIIHLRGAGGHFCSGADLSVLQALSTPEDADEALVVVNRFLQQLHTMPKPVVAIIPGVAVGAGLNLALHADFVLAAEDAMLQEPFVHIGLTTDFGGTYLLPRLVGSARAKRLALLGEKISGTEAAQMGLIYKAVSAEQLETETAALTKALRKLPKGAFAKTKEGLEQSWGFSLEEALQWEKEAQPGLILQPEFQALVQAKLKK